MTPSSFAAWVEIEKRKEEGFLLSHIYETQCPFIHIWHDSIESAKAEANLDFSVAENEWEVVTREDL